MLGQVGRYAALPAKRGQIARSLQAGPCLPGGLLRSIRSQRGLGMMLATDAMLFGWCLLAVVAAGTVILWRHRKKVRLRCGGIPLTEPEKRRLFLGSSGVIAMIVLSAAMMLYVAFWY